MADAYTTPTVGVSAVPLGQLGEGFSFAPPELSQNTRDYLNVLDIVARGTKPSTGIGNYYNPLLMTGEYSNGDVTMPVYMTEGALSPFTSKPIEENLAYTALLKGAQGSAGQLSAGPNTPVILINDKTGERVLAGTGFKAAEEAAAAAQRLTEEGGKNAAWSLYTAAPGTTDYYRAAQSEPQLSLGDVALQVAPMALSAALPGAGTFLGRLAMGAGLGGAGSVIQGRNPLKGAITGALGAAGAEFLSGPLSSLGLNNLGATSIGTGLGTAAGGLLTGQSIGDALQSGALSAGGTYAGGTIRNGLRPTPSGGGAPSGATQAGGLGGTSGSENLAIVNAPRAINPVTISGGGGSNTLRGGPADDQLEGNTGVVIGPRAINPVTISTGGGGGGGGGPLRPNEPTGMPNPDNVVTAPRPTNPVVVSTGGGGGGSAPVLDNPADYLDVAENGPPPTETKSTLEKILDYGQAGLYGASLLSTLFGKGGGGGGGGGKIPRGLAELFTRKPTDPFNTPLGAPTIPGLAPGTTGARTAADLEAQGLSQPIDWYRYGYGPEQSFFNYVPQGRRNTSRAYTGYAEGGRAKNEDSAGHRLGVLPDYHRYAVRRPRAAINANDRYVFYSGEVPVGRGSLSVNAGGRGLIPEEVRLGGEYPVGDSMFYAEDVLGEPSLGVRFPIGDATVDASTGGRRRQGFADKARLRVRVPFEDGGYAVGGPGDGRDDKIPAMLSDGEYVMDAETVAMLGNGSSKAGAQALDRFRVNVRKHKGRDLAKGSFSAKAKRPERYLGRDKK